VVLPPSSDPGGAAAPQELIAADGTITAPMSVRSGQVDGDDGTWVETSTAMAGTARITFDVALARTYTFEALVFAPGPSADSFFVQVDDNAEVEWHLGDRPEDHGTWRWITVASRSGGSERPVAAAFTPGTHTVTLRGRETGARLSAVRVLAAEAPETQLGHAARILVDYLARATGATLPVVTDEATIRPALGRLYLGWTGPYQPTLARHLDGLDGDGFIIHSTGRDLCLTGPTDWGTRFAVYEFLERHCGVRWLMPGDDGEDVPTTNNVAVPVGTDRQQPSFLGRTLPYWFDTNTPTALDWASDDPQVQFAARQRTHSRVTNVGNHNLFNIFPTRVYADPTKPTYRPELYPIVNGNTKLPTLGAASGWQPRFDIQATVDVAVDYAIGFFDANPDMPILSLAVNDGLGHSETDVDTAVINSIGLLSASRSYYTRVNKVVTTVLERRPDLSDRMFPVLAYNQVMDPPEFRLHPNVIPMVTKESHQWGEPQGQRNIRALFDSWHARTSSWALYDYSSGARYLVPRVYNTTLQQAYRYGHNVGMRYSYSDMVPAVGEGPKNWVLGKLMWNVNVDVEELTREWCERAVGPRAAAHLRNYFTIWERFWSGPAKDSGMWDYSRPRIYLYFLLCDYLAKVDPADVRRCRALLEAVVRLADTPARRARAEMIMETFRYYEAGCLSYPGAVPVPTSTGQVLALAAAMRRTLSTRIAAATTRLEIEARQEADPVLRGRIDHRRYQHTWTGYNGAELWHLVDHLRANNPRSGAVARSLEARIAEGPSDAPDVRVARLALRIARGEARQLVPNGSFDEGGQDAPPWRMIGSMMRATTGGHDDGPCLRLPVMGSTGIGSREQSLVLPIPITPGLATMRLRYKGNKKVRSGQVSIKVHLWTPEGANIYAYQQPIVPLQDTGDQWSWVSLCEDIPAEALGKQVGQLRPVASLLTYDGVGDVIFDHVEVYSENVLSVQPTDRAMSR